MAFNGNNMTPIGGNARAGDNALDRNAPMGWAYQSKTDNLEAVQSTGYFDTFHQFLVAGQFIYVSLTDQKAFVTVQSVDNVLKQVVIDPVTAGGASGGSLTFSILEKRHFPNFTESGITPLPDSVNILKGDINLAASERFINQSPGDVIQFNSEFKRKYRLIYPGIDTLFTFLEQGGFDVRSTNFEMDGANSIFMSMLNSGSLRFDDSVIDFNNTGGTIGVFKGSGSFQHLFCSFTDFFTGTSVDQGLLLENISDLQIIGNRYKSDALGSGVLIRILGMNGRAGRMISNLFEEGVGEATLYISPLMDGALLISENTFNGLGNFFQKGLTGIITNTIDQSFAAFPIDSVSDNSGRAVFNFNPTTPPHANNGMRATLSGFTGGNAVYNDTGIVQNAIFDTSFEVISETTGDFIPFVADESSGVVTANVVGIISSVDHGLSDLDVLIIRNTINYNGGYSIFDIGPANVFYINVSTPGLPEEMDGDWDSGSLDERDPRITCKQNNSTGQDGNFQKDSMTAGGWSVSGNVTETSIVDGMYGDVDFTGLTRLSYNERITVTNSVNGEIRYEGLNPKVVSIPLAFKLAPVGASGRTYQMKGVIDRGGGYVDLPDDLITDIDAQGVGNDQNIRIDRTVLMEQGDRFKWQAQGVGTTSSFIAVNADIQI